MYYLISLNQLPTPAPSGATGVFLVFSDHLGFYCCLSVDTPRIQLTKQALDYKGPIIWDNIPNFVKYSSEEGNVFRPFKDFKNNLKTFILSIGIAESKTIIDTLVHN